MGDPPEELRDLNWLEELLIARAHLVGRIVRLEERTATSYFSLKGHTVILPQDTTRLLDLLPMPLSLLPDFVPVVWVGRESLNSNRLRSHFTVRTGKVLKALLWLCRNHKDYRHVRIDEERIAAWNATEVAVDQYDIDSLVISIETVKQRASSLKCSLVTSGPSEPRREMQVLSLKDSESFC
jgi:hypothetical protein